MKNRTAYLTSPGHFEIKDSPVPSCGDNEVLIRTEYVGICGSDLMFYQDPTIGGELQTELPIVLGHECSGRVVEKGKDVKHLEIGDRVALEPGVPCGKCRYCLSGRYNLCPDVNFMAAPPWKSWALSEYIAHPANFAFQLPEGMSSMEGAMIEPLSVGVHAAERAGAAPGQSVLILGAGCIGLMTMLACKSRGVTDITVSDLFNNRLEKALALGASRVINASDTDTVKEVEKLTGGKGMELVFETAGSSATARQVPRLVQAGGKAVMVGNVHGQTPLELFEMNNKEADLLSVFRYHNTFQGAIASVAAGNIPLKEVATDFYTFDQVNEAFTCALHNKQSALKVMISMEQEG